MPKATKLIDPKSGLKTTINGKQAYKHDMPKGMQAVAKTAQDLIKRVHKMRDTAKALEKEQRAVAVATAQYKIDQQEALESTFDITKMPTPNEVKAHMTDDGKSICFYIDEVPDNILPRYARATKHLEDFLDLD